MQQVSTQEQLQYASVGWRFAAVLVDTLILFGLLIIAIMVYVIVLAARGSIDPNDAEAIQALSADLQQSTWLTNLVVFGGLFVYYAVLEALFGASIGKLVFRMRVTMTDGSRPSGLAVLVRNLVRIPEAWLLYIPSGISCLVGAKRQRLGDRTAGTVVVRRPSVAPSPARGSVAPGVAPWPGAGQAAGGSAPVAPAPRTSLQDSLLDLKTAALAARGAHLNYLRFSERELATAPTGPDEAEYSPGYVSAWYTLSDSVATLQKTRALAAAAAAEAGTTLHAATADQPDLSHLFRELEPYFSAASDEQVHEAFLRVAREPAS